MSTLEYYTVVYRVVGDKAVHNEWWAGLRPMFLVDDATISITAVSIDDLVSRCDELEAERDKLLEMVP